MTKRGKLLEARLPGVPSYARGLLGKASAKAPVIVVAVFLVLLTLLASTQVSAQQFPLPFNDFIRAMMESGFFTFIFFFGLFFVLSIASLSRIFPKNYATLIGLFVSLLMTTAAYYYGYLDRIMQEFAGPVAFWLFILLIALLFLFTMILRKGKPPSYKVILLLLTGLGILALVILRKDTIVWNYLSWAVIALGIITLIVFGMNLLGLIRGGGGEGGGRDRDRGRGRDGGKDKGMREPKGVESLSVKIIDPQDGQEFPIGAQLPFKAEIRGGTPPYRSDVYFGGAMVVRNKRSGNIVHVARGLPTARLRPGPHVLEIDTHDSGGKRKWTTAFITRNQGQFASDTITINLLPGGTELKAGIISPRGMLKLDENILLTGEIIDGAPPYEIRTVTLNGDPLPGVSLRGVPPGIFHFDLKKSAKSLDMKPGEKYTIRIEVRDDAGTSAKAETEVDVEKGALETHVAPFVFDAETKTQTPIDNAIVSVLDSKGKRVVANHTGSPGRYMTVDQVEPGAVEVTANAPGYNPNTVRRLAEAGARNLVKVPLSSGILPGHLGGVIRDAVTGKQIQPTIDLDGNPPTGARGGRYVFRNVAPGMHTLKAALAGYDPYTTRIEIRSGEAKRFDFSMIPTGTPPTTEYALTIDASMDDGTGTLKPLPASTVNVNITPRASGAATRGLVPYRGRFLRGYYRVEVPQTITVGGSTLTFRGWADGETLRRRFINLDRDVRLVAEYVSGGPPPPPVPPGRARLQIDATANDGRTVKAFMTTFKINGAPDRIPFNKVLDHGNYTIEVPPVSGKYSFIRWSDGGINPKRIIALIKDVHLVAEYSSGRTPPPPIPTPPTTTPPKNFTIPSIGTLGWKTITTNGKELGKYTANISLFGAWMGAKKAELERDGGLVARNRKLLDEFDKLYRAFLGGEARLSDLSNDVGSIVAVGRQLDMRLRGQTNGKITLEGVLHDPVRAQKLAKRFEKRIGAEEIINQATSIYQYFKNICETLGRLRDAGELVKKIVRKIR